MSTEPENGNDSKSVVSTGLLNWPSAIMLVLWFLVILGVSGISPFGVLDSPMALGIILLAAVLVTIWSALRFFKGNDKQA